MSAQKVVTLKQADAAQGNCLLGFAEIDVSTSLLHAKLNPKA
jgi:hypothetical protein